MSVTQYTAEKAAEIATTAARNDIMKTILLRAEAGERTVIIYRLTLEDCAWLLSLGYSVSHNLNHEKSLFYTISWGKK